MIRNGLGAGRIPRSEWPEEERERRAREMLCRSLNLRTTVAFVGTGCSTAFGYPSWKKLVHNAIDALRDRVPDDALDGLQSFCGDEAEQFLFVLEECRRLHEESLDTKDSHAEVLARLIGSGELEPKPNPLSHLCELPIHRFVTTNYDTELERFLGDQSDRKVESPITQQAEYAEGLAEFVVARPRHRDMIFHCHGSVDDPKSIIATETDYQDWYLHPHDPDKRAFRQSIELLLGSNPILFVGYSLDDEDLMRYLRMLGTAEARYKDGRPLFALLPWWERRHELDDEYLFQRYGVHVLRYPYEATVRSTYSTKPDSSTWNRLFCEGLTEIRKQWEAWQVEWCRKPKFRRVTIPPDSRLFVHYEWNVSEPMGRYRLDADIRSIRDLLSEDPRPSVLVLLGPGGCGKSVRAARLLDQSGAGFFWSSYYSDDWLTGVDRAIKWLKSQTRAEPVARSRMGCLRELLVRARNADGPLTLVFDGFERLLQFKGAPECGEACGAAVGEFLDVIADPKSQATVILASRLWPRQFGSLPSAGRRNSRDGDADSDGAEAPAKAAVFPVHPFSANELIDAGDPPFDRLTAESGTLLCSLLNGHAYALRLAQVYFGNVTNAEEAVETLTLALQRTPPLERVSQMIERTFNKVALSMEPRFGKGIVGRFVERLAAFMSPVGEAALGVCLRLARNEDDDSATVGERESQANKLVRELADASIATQVRDLVSGDERWTLHPLVRGYVFHRLHHTRSEDLPNFTLPGYTSGTDAVDPGSPEAARLVQGLLAGLLDAVDQCDTKNPRRLHLCRAAVGVMRSRMEANTAARWSRYDEYIRLGIRVLNAVKRVSEDGCGLWNRADAVRTRIPDKTAFEVDSENGVLYPEELAWLYNDLGLACYCEGEMHDAYAVWEEGYEINKLVEKGTTPGQFVVQSLLHLSHTFMELGKLDAAEQYLEETEKANCHLGSEDYTGRIEGYRGLIEHLRGNTALARDHYDHGLDNLKRTGGNTRAESKFLQHRADLFILLEKRDRAYEDIRVSRAIAEQGDHPDLVAYARNSLGHWLRSGRKFSGARHEYEAALDMARRKGIRRLEADVYSELSRLALNQGDPETARLRAMESMRIANELGLGLRQCHGLVVLGLAALDAEQRNLGIAYLRVAYRLSRERGYWLRAQEADEQLRRLGEAPERLQVAPEV